MKFGMFYVLESPDGDYQRAYKEMFGQIEYAEELGWDSVWLAEHHGSPYGSMPSPQLAMTSIAMITERMRIGLAVSILPFDNPVRIAEDFAMVDVISGGRLDLGVGRGYQPREFKMLGLADQQQHSREIFEEELEILIGLWENETFSYQGKFFQLDDVTITPRPVQKPRPPLYVAAISPSTFELVRKYDLNVLVTPTLMSLDELKTFVLKAKQDLCEAGHDPLELNFPMNWQMHLAETEEEALDSAVRSARLVLQPGHEARAERADCAEGLRVHGQPGRGVRSRGRGVDQRPAGRRDHPPRQPEKVRQKIEEVYTEIGQQEIFCWMRIGGLEDKKVRVVDEALRRGSDAVLPGQGADRPRLAPLLTASLGSERRGRFEPAGNEDLVGHGRLAWHRHGPSPPGPWPRGDRVALLARSEFAALAASDPGGSALAVRADVTDAGAVARAVQDVVAAWGGVDVLVNNAGVHRGGRVERLAPSDWEAVLATNLTAPLTVARAVSAPHGSRVGHREHRGGGRIPGISGRCPLWGGQGGSGRADPGAGRGARPPGYPCEPGRARLHRDGDDRGAVGARPAGSSSSGSPWAEPAEPRRSPMWWPGWPAPRT